MRKKKLIFVWKVEYQGSFWNRGKCSSEMSHCYDYKDVPQFSVCTRRCLHRESWAVVTHNRLNAVRTNIKMLEWSWDNFAPLPLVRPRPFTLRRGNLKTEVSLWKRLRFFSVHTRPKEFGNGGFTLKAHQIFFPSTLHRRNFGQGNHITTSFSTSSIFRQNVFRPHENKKPAFSNSSGLKSSVFVTD